MKIVIAPDKFKGSLTGLELCNVVKKVLEFELPNTEIISLPLADGGDGTIEVANNYLNGTSKTIQVSNPIFKVIKASYLYSKATQTAFIEMAEASGLKLLSAEERDCKSTTTLGTGELIIDALNNNVKHIILGIGGSATNDCGIGMATALGYRFLDVNNDEVKPIGKNLSKINSIDDSQVHPKLKEVSIKVASDVINPLYGKNGAAYVYTKQKGATKEDIELLDKGLQDFSKVIDKHFNIKSQTVEGAGAAGGMGIAAIAFLNAQLLSGIELIKNLANFDEQIKDADWIITGEGNLDSQTLFGKAISGVLASAKRCNIPVAAFCGQITLNENELKDIGISYSDSVINHSKNLEDALSNPQIHLEKMVMNFIDFLKE